MTQIHTSYKVSKMLKEFLGESAPEPIDGVKYCSGCEAKARAYLEGLPDKGEKK